MFDLSSSTLYPSKEEISGNILPVLIYKQFHMNTNQCMWNHNISCNSFSFSAERKHEGCIWCDPRILFFWGGGKPSQYMATARGQKDLYGIEAPPLAAYRGSYDFNKTMYPSILTGDYTRLYPPSNQHTESIGTAYSHLRHLAILAEWHGGGTSCWGMYTSVHTCTGATA